MKNMLKRYDIVLVNFGQEVIGSEQGGIRPALIIQNDKGNLHSSTTIVMPLTKHLKGLHLPTHTLLEKRDVVGLTEDSLLLGECMRQISEERIIKYIGRVVKEENKNEIKRVYNAIFEWED